MMKLRRKYKAEGVIMIKAHKCIRPLLCIKRILLKIYEKGLEMQIKLSYRIAIFIINWLIFIFSYIYIISWWLNILSLNKIPNCQVIKSIVKLLISKVTIINFQWITYIQNMFFFVKLGNSRRGNEGVA